MESVDVSTGAPPLPFDEVYRRHAAPVFRFCLSQVRDPTDAEDLAADVFAAAFAAYERTGPDPDGVLPWLLRISRNAAIDHHRRRTRRATLLDRFRRHEVPEALSTDIEHEVVLRSELREVLAHCQRLSTRERTLIGLRVAADLSFKEVGAVLGISEHAATMATKRALQRLRTLHRGQS